MLYKVNVIHLIGFIVPFSQQLLGLKGYQMFTYFNFHSRHPLCPSFVEFTSTQTFQHFHPHSDSSLSQSQFSTLMHMKVEISTLMVT